MKKSKNIFTASVLFFAGMVSISAAQASTSQFVARLYTEALGRAPDESGWASYSVANSQSGANCQIIDFASLANKFYSSVEYNNLNYTSAEKVLTVYRGLLNREPETLSTVQYWAQQLDSGLTMATFVADIVSGAEFIASKNIICSTSGNSADPAYRWGTAPAITIDTTMTATALQASLNAAQGTTNLVILPARTIIYADRNINIPAGVTLTSAGITSRQQYAHMARIVRTAHFGGDGTTGKRGDQTLISLESGAKLSYVWVSGQREAVIGGQTLPYKILSSNIYLRGGNSTSVISSRLDTTAGNSNIGIDGTAEGSPCNNVVIADNLITGYMNTHYPVNIAGQYFGEYSDGVTVACEKTSVTGNHIVDASDVGVVLFRSGSVSQTSIVSNNIIVSAGISAFAAMNYEPYSSPVAPTTYSFAGSQFDNNRFWTSGDSHFDIGLAAGTKAWATTNNIGYGGSMTNNSNKGIISVMQIGIGIDGMQTTAVNGNTLSYRQQTNGVCPTKGAIVVNPDSSRATPGSIASGTSFIYGALDGCHMGTH